MHCGFLYIVLLKKGLIMVISRFKKWVLCTGLLISFSLSTAVAASIQINNATPMEIKSYILTNKELRHPNSTVNLIPRQGASALQMGSDSSDMIVFNSAKKLRVGLFGEASVKTNRYTYFSISTSLNHLGSEVSYYESAELYSLQKGGFGIERTSTDESERIILNTIKLYFDGGYTNGYTLSRTKGKKGYPIEKIDPNSPAEKAGLKVGDLIVKVNGQKVKFIKDTNTFNISNNIDAKENEIVTIASNSGVEKNITLETGYWNPKTGMFE